MAYNKKEEVKTAAETAQAEKVELTKEELDALVKKKENAVRQQIAMEQAREEAKKALEEQAKQAKEEVLSDMDTRKILNEEPKYKVIVYPAEGEKNGNMGVININGIKFKFKYGEETVLPESALSVLENSKTFGAPKFVKDADGSHYEPQKIQKRAFSARPMRSDAKLNV